MDRLLIISGFLPYEVEKKDGALELQPRVGGFNTGLKTFSRVKNSLWFGTIKNKFNDEEKTRIEEQFDEKKCKPLFLNGEISHLHDCFCHDTIWPLFHYFPQYTRYSSSCWEGFVQFNELFAEKISKHIQKGDKIWIHDFQLMLLPKILRERFPDVSIGFFLHVPFPSYEIFRLLPWRTQILEGLLGADLIGFHTYDYERHFLSCVRRLLGYETVFNQIRMEDKVVKAENFPMGIDFERFYKAAKNHHKKEKKLIHGELYDNYLKSQDRKIILSIDRLDYSKGIADRLRSYEYFLKNFPEYREKVSLFLFVVPSREEFEQYNELKREIDELVGRINGKYGVLNWMPIWYFYRVLPFEELIEIYCEADIGLITPTRDGMNLMSKEFIACRANGTGSLIVSEMAGSSKEMGEAFIVNPNNRAEIANALEEALNLPEKEQNRRIRSIQKRLQHYTESKWAGDFLYALAGVKKIQATNYTKKINPKILDVITNEYIHSNRRILFLDYDGTLSGFNPDPQKAGPDQELYDLLKKLTEDDKNEIIIISGRDKETLSKWFDENWKITFIAEHGVWTRFPMGKWRMAEKIDKQWMDIIRPLIEFYVDRTPRTFLEEKNYSLAWHYRNADPDLGLQRSWELKDELKNLVSNLNLEIMDGDKVIEIKYSGINKGRAASMRMADKSYDFIFAIGDDWTDEYTFQAMPKEAFTVKVGTKSTVARFYIEDVAEVRKLLTSLVNCTDNAKAEPDAQKG